MSASCTLMSHGTGQSPSAEPGLCIVRYPTRTAAASGVWNFT